MTQLTPEALAAWNEHGLSQINGVVAMPVATFNSVVAYILARSKDTTTYSAKEEGE